MEKQFYKTHSNCTNDINFVSGSELLDLEIYCKWRHMAVIPSLDIDSESELTPKQMAVFKQIMTSFGSTKSVGIINQLIIYAPLIS